MSRVLFPGACVVLLLTLAGAPAAPAPDPDAEVKAIIARAIEARGGAANLETYKAVTVKFQITYSNGNEQSGGSGIQYLQVPDKSRSEWSIKLAWIACSDFSMTQVFDGQKGWRSLNGVVTELDKDEVATYREQAYVAGISDLHGLNAKGVKLASLGGSKVGGKAAVGVRVSSKGHPDISLYFDKDTGQLLKRVYSGEAGAGVVKFTAETLYSDYRNVSGRMVAFRVRETRNGIVTTMDFSEVKLAEKLPDATFSKP